MAAGGANATSMMTERRSVRGQLSSAERTVFHPASLNLGLIIRTTSFWFRMCLAAFSYLLFFRCLVGFIRTFGAAAFLRSRAWASFCAVFCRAARAV